MPGGHCNSSCKRVKAVIQGDGEAEDKCGGGAEGYAFGTNEEEEQRMLALGFVHEDRAYSSTVKNSLSQQCVSR